MPHWNDGNFLGTEKSVLVVNVVDVVFPHFVFSTTIFALVSVCQLKREMYGWCNVTKATGGSGDDRESERKERGEVRPLCLLVRRVFWMIGFAIGWPLLFKTRWRTDPALWVLFSFNFSFLFFFSSFIFFFSFSFFGGTTLYTGTY